MDRREHRKENNGFIQGYSHIVLDDTFSKKLGRPPKWNEQLAENSSESSTPRVSFLGSRESVKKEIMMVFIIQ